MLMLLVRGEAQAHMNYPPLCCNGTGTTGDCRPVACEELEEVTDGINWGKIHFDQKMIHPSMDNDCHVCVGTNYHGGPIPHCVFIRATS